MTTTISPLHSSQLLELSQEVDLLMVKEVIYLFKDLASEMTPIHFAKSTTQCIFLQKLVGMRSDALFLDHNLVKITLETFLFQFHQMEWIGIASLEDFSTIHSLL
jgi:hypothetical protein